MSLAAIYDRVGRGYSGCWEMGAVVDRVSDRCGLLTLPCRPTRLQPCLPMADGTCSEVKADLQSEFPDAKGFSTRNLWYMKRWYQFYAAGGMREKLHQLGAEMASTSTAQLAQVANTPHSEFLHQK